MMYQTYKNKAIFDKKTLYVVCNTSPFSAENKLVLYTHTSKIDGSEKEETHCCQIF